MRRPVLLFSSLGLILLGAIFVAQGVWIQAKAGVAQVLLEQAWARTLKGEESAKPWEWADTWPVAALEVPAKGKRAIVLYGAFGEAMAFGPGHMIGTPMPGERGLSVIAAHRDTHFAFLKDLEIKDEISVTRADGSKHFFEIMEISVVPWDQSGLDPFGSEKEVALVTCYPFGAVTPGPLRYVARGTWVRKESGNVVAGRKQ